MKIQELLLELREVLNREMHGSWINANTSSIDDMKYEGDHAKYIKSHLIEWGIPESYIKSSDDYYTIGFANGLVRTLYRPKGTLTIDGLSKDIKKISSIILASAAQDDVNTVAVNKVNKLGDTTTNTKIFSMPRQRKELQLFLTT